MLSHSVVSHSAAPWTVARQGTLSMGFSRQEYWSGLPYPPLGDLLDLGMEPVFSALAGRFFTTSATWEAHVSWNSWHWKTWVWITWIHLYVDFFQWICTIRMNNPWLFESLDVELWISGVKWSEVKVSQSCLTLCNPMACRVHGILQIRMLKWVAIPFSRGSSLPRDWTLVSYVSCIAGRFFTHWAIRGALTLPQKEKIRLKTRNMNSNLVQSIISHVTSENLLPLWSVFVCLEGVGVFLFPWALLLISFFYFILI